MNAKDALEEASEALDKALESGELLDDDWDMVNDMKQRIDGMRKTYIV